MFTFLHIPLSSITHTTYSPLARPCSPFSSTTSLHHHLSSTTLNHHSLLLIHYSSSFLYPLPPFSSITHYDTSTTHSPLIHHHPPSLTTLTHHPLPLIHLSSTLIHHPLPLIHLSSTLIHHHSPPQLWRQHKNQYGRKLRLQFEDSHLLLLDGDMCVSLYVCFCIVCMFECCVFLYNNCVQVFHMIFSVCVCMCAFAKSGYVSVMFIFVWIVICLQLCLLYHHLLVSLSMTLLIC